MKFSEILNRKGHLFSCEGRIFEKTDEIHKGCYYNAVEISSWDGWQFKDDDEVTFIC